MATKRLDERGWSEKTVSWGHMLIALAVMVGSIFAWSWNASRDYAATTASTERRLTQLEERYLQVAKRNEEQDANMANMLQIRNQQIGRMEVKLDTIAADVVSLKVQSATMQQQLQRRF